VLFRSVPLVGASLKGTSPVVDLGQGEQLQAMAYGGSSIDAYSYSGLPNGCPSADSATLSCTPAITGSYLVQVVVSESLGPTVNATFAFLVNPDPVVTDFLASPAATTAGTETVLSVTAAGGTGPFTYSYSGLPSDCPGVNSAVLTCRSAQAGAYNVTVHVADTRGLLASGTVRVVVNPVPTISSFTATPASAPTGSDILLVATVSGGTAPLSYTYGGLPADCTKANSSELTCRSGIVGSYTVTVRVTDNRGVTANAMVQIGVVAPAQPSGNGGWGGLTFFEWLLVAAIVGVALVGGLLLARPKPAPEGAAPHASPKASVAPSPLLPKAGPLPLALRLSQRVIVHLGGHGAVGPYEPAPQEATQAGIAAALGVRQSNVANALGRLVQGGLVAEAVRHVQGQPRRLKVYQLTPKGQMLSRELRNLPPRGPAE
jgi:hypothetical protein